MRQVLMIQEITLDWSKWYKWALFLLDARKDKENAANPPEKPGIYEARIIGVNERLTIGKASNLRRRVKQGLVKGKVPHTSGDKIRKYENLNIVEVRWAETSRPAAAEEELHHRYVKRNAKMPKYTDHT